MRQMRNLYTRGPPWARAGGPALVITGVMRLQLTPALRQLVADAASDEGLSQELRAVAEAGAAPGATSVDWDTVKALVEHARQQRGFNSLPHIDQLCQGSGIAFPQPRKPVGKPPELQRHLDQLKARLEQQQYDRMVHDVTQDERVAAALREGGLVTYKQQVSFGIHVLAMMAAFYVFGHVAGMAITSNKAVHPFVGLVLMVAALVLETVLYIIRTSVPPRLHKVAAQRAQAARIARQQQQLQQELAVQQAGLGGGAGASAITGARAGAVAVTVAAAGASAADAAAGLPAGQQALRGVLPEAAAGQSSKPPTAKKDD